MRVTAREVAAGLGVPYEIVTRRPTQVNFSSARVGLMEFRRRCEALQHNVIVFQFCRRVWRRFVTTEILSGRFDAPGFEHDPEPYLAARWMPPRFPWVDPLQGRPGRGGRDCERGHVPQASGRGPPKKGGEGEVGRLGGKAGRGGSGRRSAALWRRCTRSCFTAVESKVRLRGRCS